MEMMPASVPVIDPFRRRQVPDVAGRFLRERKRHRRQAGCGWNASATRWPEWGRPPR
jgi:hypothetical protein